MASILPQHYRRSTSLKEDNTEYNNIIDINNNITTTKSESETSQLKFQQHYHLIWFYLWIVGTINNFAYVVVLSSAKSVAMSFHAVEYIGMIAWANVGVGMFIKILNTTMEHYKHSTRLYFSVSLMMVGLVIIAVSNYVDFVFCIFGIVILGCFSALGESVYLGLLKLYPPALTGAWASGTGMAGVGGTAYYLGFTSILASFGFSQVEINEYCFLSLIPQALIYCYITYQLTAYTRKDGIRLVSLDEMESTNANDSIYSRLSINESKIKRNITVPKISANSPNISRNTYYTTEKKRTNSEVGNNYGTLPNENSNNLGSFYVPSASERNISGEGVFLSKVTTRRGSTTTSMGMLQNSIHIVDEEVKTSFADYWRAFMLVLSASSQLAAVYFFEYVVSVGYASLSNPMSSPSWFTENQYVILSFCYQFGVLVSRSSISFLTIKRIEILTTLQGINFVAWLLHILHPFMPLWLQFIWMAYVGLLGGAMYVNTFYSIMTDENITDADREKCINITSVMVMVGIVASSVFDIIVAKYF